MEDVSPPGDGTPKAQQQDTPGVRTTYERAARGFDEQFKDALVAEITDAIAKASLVTDANIMALRTGETIEALIVCLISMAALSPHFDTPSHLREFAEKLARRVRRSVARARAEGIGDRLHGSRREGRA
jgi:hypothetical protein